MFCKFVYIFKASVKASPSGDYEDNETEDNQNAQEEEGKSIDRYFQIQLYNSYILLASPLHM